MLPLCTSAVHDDVKTLALFSLIMFKEENNGEIAEHTARLLFALMADSKNNLFNSTKPSDQVGSHSPLFPFLDICAIFDYVCYFWILMPFLGCV